MRTFVSSLFLWVENLGIVRWGPVAQSRQWGCHPGLSSSGFDLMAQLGRMLLGCWSEGLRASVGWAHKMAACFSTGGKQKEPRRRSGDRKEVTVFRASPKERHTITLRALSSLESSGCLAHPQWGKSSGRGGVLGSHFEVAEHRSGSVFDCDYCDS